MLYKSYQNILYLISNVVFFVGLPVAEGTKKAYYFYSFTLYSIAWNLHFVCWPVYNIRIHRCTLYIFIHIQILIANLMHFYRFHNSWIHCSALNCVEFGIKQFVHCNLQRYKCRDEEVSAIFRCETKAFSYFYFCIHLNSLLFFDFFYWLS